MYKFLDEGITYSDLDTMQKTKADWLEESNYSDNTKRSYWIALNGVRYMEESLNKDLYQFTKREIEDLIKSKPTTRIGTKMTLFSVISMYINYCCERGLNPVVNPCDRIITSELFEANARLLEHNYLTLNKFYDMLDNLDISEIDRMLLTLLRYGVNPNDVGKIKWEDVDKENKILKVDTGKKVLYLPVDDEFINMVDIAYFCEGYKEKVVFIDLGYIIKTTKNCNWETIEPKDIHNKINNFCRANKVPRISPNDLRLARKFDILFDRLENNKEITMNDYREVLELLDGVETQNRVTGIKNLFEAISGTKTVTNRKR